MAPRSKEFKFVFLGKDCTSHLHSKQTFVRKFGSCAAITLLNERSIHFRKDQFLLELILHELWHLGLANMNIEHSDLTMEQFEEVSASFFSTEIITMLKIAVDIQTFFLLQE